MRHCDGVAGAAVRNNGPGDQCAASAEAMTRHLYSSAGAGCLTWLEEPLVMACWPHPPGSDDGSGSRLEGLLRQEGGLEVQKVGLGLAGAPAEEHCNGQRPCPLLFLWRRQRIRRRRLPVQAARRQTAAAGAASRRSRCRRVRGGLRRESRTSWRAPGTGTTVASLPRQPDQRAIWATSRTVSERSPTSDERSSMG